MTSTPMTPMYTIAEVAELTRMSEYWLREQCRQARVPHHRLGRSYRFTEFDLAQLLRESRVQARPDPCEQALTPTRHQR
jgi:excisionase family DNA binding protein